MLPTIIFAFTLAFSILCILHTLNVYVHNDTDRVTTIVLTFNSIISWSILFYLLH